MSANDDQIRDSDGEEYLDDEEAEEVAELDNPERTSGTSAGGESGFALGYDDPDDEDIGTDIPGDGVRRERNREEDE
jgi:hypothetical protein